MSRYASHTLSRLAIYALLWVVSVILLGLTAYRVNVTETQFESYELIIVELLVTCILTILWAPFAFLMLTKDRFNDTFGSPRVHHEMIGVAILWLFWLVGAADTTNQILPGHNYCFTDGKQCDVLTAILAFAWIGWSLLSLLFVLALLNNAALTGAALPTAATRDKRANQVAA